MLSYDVPMLITNFFPQAILWYDSALSPPDAFHLTAAAWSEPRVTRSCILAWHVAADQDNRSSKSACAGLQLALQCLQVIKPLFRKAAGLLGHVCQPCDCLHCHAGTHQHLNCCVVRSSMGCMSADILAMHAQVFPQQPAGAA